MLIEFRSVPVTSIDSDPISAGGDLGGDQVTINVSIQAEVR
jgi:hypothetical protein